MDKLYSAPCRFCDQIVMIECGADSAEEALNIAFDVCECEGAKAERRKKTRIKKAQSMVVKLFGDGALSENVVPLAADSVSMLLEAVEAVARGQIDKFMLRVPDLCKAEVSITGKGLIKVKRVEGISIELTE